MSSASFVQRSGFEAAAEGAGRGPPPTDDEQRAGRSGPLQTVSDRSLHAEVPRGSIFGRPPVQSSSF